MTYDNILETIGRIGIYLILTISAGIIVGLYYPSPTFFQENSFGLIGIMGAIWAFQPILKMENWRKE